MKEIRPLFLVAARNGLIASMLAFGMIMTLFYLDDNHPFLISPFLDFRVILFVVFIFITLKEFRDGYNQGALQFWQGLAGSYFFIGVFAVITSILIVLFSMYDVTFVTEYNTLVLEKLRNNPDFIKQIGGQEAFERNFNSGSSTNSIRLAFWYLGWSFWYGLIGIILSVILRKQPKPN